ncbi:MAG: ROK family protein [Dehalococcoidales bacterium]|jgi:glucokinase
MKSEKKLQPVVGVDIGGTKIMTAVFSPSGGVLAKEVRPTLGSEGVNKTIGRVCAAIAGLLNDRHISISEIGAVCIACAGGIDTGRGVVVTPSPNLPGWVEIPLAAMVKERFGVDVFVLNDASAAALGEHRYGAGKGVPNLVMLTLGTGIGGGIIIDGKLYLGAVGGAGELGHMTIDANGPRCGCGNTGCLEILASGTAIARDAVARLDRGEKSSLGEMVGGDLSKINAELVGKAARRGDKLSQDVIARAARYLGIGMVNVVNIFNPELVIIGGGMADMGEMIVGQGRKMAAELPFSINARAARVLMARLGNEAGIYGAAAFALDNEGRTG